MSSLGDIVIGLKMDHSQFSGATRSARGGLSSLADIARSAAGALAGLLGGASVTAALGFGVKLAAEAEQSQIAFEVMLGSGAQARAMLSSLKQFSDRSPFDQLVPREAAQTLLNFGVSADSILPTIRMLGDVAAGDGQKLKQLALVFGQMSATGRLMGQDLLQFINAGFNPLQQIAVRTGESMATLKKRMEAGGISAQEVAQAFKDATSAGGRFFGMTERQASSLSGLWSTTKDTVISTLMEIGTAIIETLDLKGVLKSSIEWLKVGSDFVKRYGREIVGIAAIISGALVGALAAYAAWQSVLIAKQITLLSLSGPKGWAILATALVGAALAASQVAAGFSKVEQEARAAAKASRDVADAAPAKNGQQSQTQQLVALQKRLRELQQVGAHSPELAQRLTARELDNADLPGLLGIKQTTEAAAEASGAIQQMRNAIVMLRESAALSEDDRASRIAVIETAIRSQLDAESGITAEIAKQRAENQKLQEELNPNLVRERFQQGNASNESLAILDTERQIGAELEKQKQQREEIAQQERQQAEDLQRQQKQYQETLQARAERLIESTMTTAEKQAQELRDIEELWIKGLIDEATFKKASDQVTKSNTTPGRSTSAASSAAIAGSSEAASTLLRGSFATKNLESLAKKRNDLAARHLALAEKQDQLAPIGAGQQWQVANF